MKTNSQKLGSVTNNSRAMGTADRSVVLKRARELAAISGRSAHEPSDSDFAQAKRELTGKPDMDANTEILEAAPESERWDPVPGSTGHKVPVAASEDEDSEGRSDNEKLVDQGVAEAEHDQMAQAVKAGRKQNS